MPVCPLPPMSSINARATHDPLNQHSCAVKMHVIVTAPLPDVVFTAPLSDTTLPLKQPTSPD